MGSGISQTDEQIVEGAINSLNQELQEKIKNLKESGLCHPDYINYAIYLLKAEANSKKNSVILINESKLNNYYKNNNSE